MPNVNSSYLPLYQTSNTFSYKGTVYSFPPVSTPFSYKGTVASDYYLPNVADIGDVYRIFDTSDFKVYDGTRWVVLTDSLSYEGTSINDSANIYPSFLPDYTPGSEPYSATFSFGSPLGTIGTYELRFDCDLAALHYFAKAELGDVRLIRLINLTTNKVLLDRTESTYMTARV